MRGGQTLQLRPPRAQSRLDGGVRLCVGF
jgi:hypothetical protein